MGISEAAKTALQPYVGPTVADTCVRATALSLGKMSDELDSGDFAALEGRIRKLLAPIAPRAAIDNVLSSISAAVSTAGGVM